MFYLETILGRLIYGGNRRIRVESDLRQAAMNFLMRWLPLALRLHTSCATIF